MNKLKTIKMIFAGAAISLSSAYASDKALVDTLVSGGYLTEEQADRILSKEAASFSSKGKETKKVRFNGRLHYQYDALNSEANDGDEGSTNHFYFRRLRMGAKASLSDNWYAETVLEFAGDENPEIGLDKAYIGYKASSAADFALGFKKVPFGYEETESSAKIPVIERSAATRFFSDDIDFGVRHSGIFVKGKLDGGFKYAASFTNAIQGEGSRLGGTSSASTNFMAVGSVRWSGKLSDDVKLTIGVDGGYQSENNVVDDQVTAFATYAALEAYGAKLVAEYIKGSYDEAGADPFGYHVTLSYRAGSWEPVVRYTYVDADGSSTGIDEDELIRRAPSGVTASDEELSAVYLGVNYHFNKAVKFMLGYEMAETEGTGGEEVEIDGVRARVQLLW